VGPCKKSLCRSFLPPYTGNSEEGSEEGGKKAEGFPALDEAKRRLPFIADCRRIKCGDEPAKPKEELGRLVTDWRLPFPRSGESGQMSA